MSLISNCHHRLFVKSAHVCVLVTVLLGNFSHVLPPKAKTLIRLEDRTGPLFCTPGVASTPVSRHNPRGSFGTPPCVTSFEHGWAVVAKQNNRDRS